MATRVSASQLVGRDSELAQLGAALAAVAPGSPGLVTIAGESGVGKSRLLGEFLARARDAGARTFGGDCIELGEDEIPYAPLISALRPLVRDGDPALAALSATSRDALARLVPELGESSATHGEESRLRPLEGLVSLLERLADEEKIVFWLDDAQWADGATRHFLAYLASACEEASMLTVIAFRSEELGRRHPLRPLLAKLERAGGARRLALAPFDRGELATQLRDILGADPEPSVLDRLFERSEGNPLFAEELLAAGRDGRGELPETLRDALLLRVERLSEPAQAALRLLSAVGRADHGVLAAASGLTDADLEAGLREAVAAQVILVGRGDRFGFRHALLREVIYDDLLPRERAAAHLNLARALEARAPSAEERGGWAAAVAHHYNAGGDQPEALRSAVAAARATEELGAPGASANLLDRAVALWPRVAEPETRAGMDHPTLLSLAARAHELDADPSHAVALYEAALAELDPDREPHRVADALTELSAARWTLGRADAAREDVDRALALLPESDPTPERARILEQKARFLLLQGRLEACRDASLEALAAAEAAGETVAEAGVLSRLGLALYFLGEEAEGDAKMRESIDLAREHGPNDKLSTAFVNYSDALNHAGRSRDALRVAEDGAREVASGDRSGVWIACARAEILFDLGRWDESEAVLPGRKTVAAGTTLSNLLLRRTSLLLGRGDTVKARARVEAILSNLNETIEPQYIAVAGALAAELERREGNLTAARAAVEAAIDRLEYCSEDSARMAYLAAAGAAVEADFAEAARARGEEAEVERSTALAELMAARAQAAAEDRPGRLVEAAHALGAAAHLARARRAKDGAARAAAAATAWAELERPYPAAQQRWHAAECAIAAGDRATAAAEAGEGLARSREIGAFWLAAELEGLVARARLAVDDPTPVAKATADRDDAEAPASEDPFGLTPREREVLALLAEGATNRQIGERLFMAEKTASVHVSRILAKLDVSSRTEAAAVAYRLDLTG